MINENDINLARNARLFAHAPYSNFKVGAVLRCKNGKVYMGCNIENHGIQGICAERTAFVKALSEGEREFESIAVVGGNAKEEPTIECMPCGYCRQFMSEFVDKDFKIFTLNDEKINEYTMEQILPYNFVL